MVQLSPNIYGAHIQSLMLEVGNICTEAEDIMPCHEECSVQMRRQSMLLEHLSR